jgi:hypothetical protein
MMFLISEGWPHSFPGFGERVVRFVFDTTTLCITKMHIASNGRWAPATPEQMEDVSRSVVDNLDMADPLELGLTWSTEEPDWVKE